MEKVKWVYKGRYYYKAYLNLFYAEFSLQFAQWEYSTLTLKKLLFQFCFSIHIRDYFEEDMTSCR